MKKILLNLAVTLDGFIEGPNGETDWCIMDDDMNFEEFLSGIDTIFFGRISYDEWKKYRPGPDADTSEKNMWNVIDSKRKVVFSSQIRNDEKAEYVSSGLEEKVAEIKLQQGMNLILLSISCHKDKKAQSFTKMNFIHSGRLCLSSTFCGI